MRALSSLSQGEHHAVEATTSKLMKTRYTFLHATTLVFKLPRTLGRHNSQLGYFHSQNRSRLERWSRNEANSIPVCPSPPVQPFHCIEQCYSKPDNAWCSTLHLHLQFVEKTFAEFLHHATNNSVDHEVSS